MLGPHAYDTLVSAFGGGEDGAALADWAFLTRCVLRRLHCSSLACVFVFGPYADVGPDYGHARSCDALAISNSTFSFSAAMLASAAAAEKSRRCSSGGDDVNVSHSHAAFRAVRPDPVARALVPFDPWDALPTLKRGDA